MKCLLGRLENLAAAEPLAEETAEGAIAAKPADYRKLKKLTRLWAAAQLLHLMDKWVPNQLILNCVDIHVV